MVFFLRFVYSSSISSLRSHLTINVYTCVVLVSASGSLFPLSLQVHFFFGCWLHVNSLSCRGYRGITPTAKRGKNVVGTILIHTTDYLIGTNCIGGFYILHSRGTEKNDEHDEHKLLGNEHTKQAPRVGTQFLGTQQ